MTDVEHSSLTALRPAKELKRLRWVLSIVAVVVVSLSTVTLFSRPSDASGLSNDRAKAAILVRQINRIDNEISLLGQKYDDAQLKLDRINNVITNARATVLAIGARVARSNVQLREDVIFSYVTNGVAGSSNVLFSDSVSRVGATNVYSQLAEGNIGATIASLKNDRVELTQERGVLRAEDAHARAVTRDQAASYHKAKLLQAGLAQTLAQVKGQISTYVNQVEAATVAQSAATLQGAAPIAGFPAPPPDSKANIAIRAAMSYIGVPYVWGGASRSGVDCSGLVMLAYEAAGIDFPHYSGAMYQDTERVPLYDIEPGDLLFYGPGGDTHVAMYVGHGEMIEAEMPGTVVHIVPIRLGYGFVGLGRPRG